MSYMFLMEIMLKRMLLFLLLITAFTAAVFCDVHSKNFIEELNGHERITDEFIQKINDAQDSWTAGHNFPPGTKFSDLTMLLGAIRQKAPVIKYSEVNSKLHIPKSFDARTHWRHCISIREIKNQGHCGSCWAVSSATTMSDRLCISSKGKFNGDISAQEITSCSEGNGCHGGWPYSAWKHFVQYGAPTGGDFNSKKGCQPYLVKPCINRTVNYEDELNGLSEITRPEQCEATDYVKTPPCQLKCYNKHYHKNYKSDLHFGKDVYGLPNNVTEIQLNILKYGPVVADFKVYADFMTYKSGVYEHTVDKSVGGHAIRILGWGEENGKEYWIIANQWGKEWGHKGVVKFRRGINECGIEEHVVSGITG